MPSLCLESVKSRLGQSLLELQQRLEHFQEQERAAESRFENWHGRWKTRRDEISHHLAHIESELKSTQGPESLTPALTVIGLPATCEPATFGF